MKLKKFFWILSGEDVNVIDKCNKNTRNRFTIIGTLVASIFTLCFISCYFTFTHLLQNLWLGIVIGLFFAWMITNIYLFLLYTLTKKELIHKPKRSTVFISVSIRFIFIAFFSIIVSKPIESSIFSTQIEYEIQIFKKKKIEKYTKTTNRFFNKEINEYKTLLNASNDDFYLNLIKKRKKENMTLIDSMEQLVEKSNYYIQGIIILNNKYPISWVLTIIFLMLFIVPAYLKMSISEDSIFCKTNHKVESELIKYEYKLFKKRYNEIFKKKYGLDLHYDEHYSDAPFNTKRKINKKEFLKEEDLLESIYA